MRLTAPLGHVVAFPPRERSLSLLPYPSGLLVCEAADCAGLFKLVLVLPAPRREVRRDHEIEDVVSGVEPDGRAAQRFLEVDIPAKEAPVGCAPQGPEGMGRAGTRQHQHRVVPPDAITDLPDDAESFSEGPRTIDRRSVRWVQRLLDLRPCRQEEGDA